MIYFQSSNSNDGRVSNVIGVVPIGMGRVPKVMGEALKVMRGVY